MEYTSEQLNYFRICYIAFNLVPEALREVFKQEWNFLYMTTPFGKWEDIPQNGHDFYNNETTKTLKKCSIFNDNTKRKHGRVGLQLSNFCNLVFGYNWHHAECGNQKRS